MRGTFNQSGSLLDEDFLDMVQSQTLKYFWEFGHPVSGMARERSNAFKSYDYLHTVATGATGFGVMAMIAGAERGFLNKVKVKARIHQIVNFLASSPSYHGAFPHFMHGISGHTIPFSQYDDGGDLVETSFLMSGLLCARQYFFQDKNLHGKINKLWDAVEWDFYTRGKDALYWHWSPKHDWAMNMKIQGWNEGLISYVMAASSRTHSIDGFTYEKGWASGKHFKNGGVEHNIALPLGPEKGGPLFFAHYSFLGLDPRGLKDKYADYWIQGRHHTLVNRAHCIENPGQFAGYGAHCWGLTASDDINVYDAHSPINDNGTISPTAAISSFPYTPEYSMQAMRHFYEDLGDMVWGEYGFKDAFNLSQKWVAEGYLGIDQGPIVVMIENYRSGLLWNLFMSCPEIRHGLEKLSFESPHLKKPRNDRKFSP